MSLRAPALASDGDRDNVCIGSGVRIRPAWRTAPQQLQLVARGHIFRRQLAPGFRGPRSGAGWRLCSGAQNTGHGDRRRADRRRCFWQGNSMSVQASASRPDSELTAARRQARIDVIGLSVDRLFKFTRSGRSPCACAMEVSTLEAHRHRSASIATRAARLRASCGRPALRWIQLVGQRARASPPFTCSASFAPATLRQYTRA